MTSEERRAVLSGVQTIREAIRLHATYTLAKRWNDMTRRDVFLATSMAVRDCLIDGILETEDRYQQADAKSLYYLSMEFLVGRSLGNNLLNLGLLDLCRQALLDLGVDLEEVRESDPDAALGNGGLGRLAACFLDSLATLGMPGFGYGINYEYGLFKQEIENGYQKEQPDHWRAHRSPWLCEPPHQAGGLSLYGRRRHVAKGPDQQNPPAGTGWKIRVCRASGIANFGERRGRARN